MEEEPVFKISGEGGGITITRLRFSSGDKFIYHHSEFDPNEEGLVVNIREEYDNFEIPFGIIDEKYPWPELYISTIHSDYKNYVIERLIPKLNNSHIPIDWLNHVKRNVKESLGIQLNYTVGKNEKVSWVIEN